MKVNIKTLTATREGIPMPLIGLSADTLRNLQTALNPVPAEYIDIEYWDEVDITPTYDNTTHTLDGTETLTADIVTKTVKVAKGIRAKTAEELATELAELIAAKTKATETAVQAHINSVVVGLGYDDENSIAKYLVPENPFYTECKAISLWIGAVWTSSYAIQTQVAAGTIPEPTAEELIAMLPMYGV